MWCPVNHALHGHSDLSNDMSDKSKLIPAVAIGDAFFDFEVKEERRDAAKHLLMCLQRSEPGLELNLFTKVPGYPDIEKMVEASVPFLIQYEFIRNDKELCSVFNNFLQADIGTQPSMFFFLENTRNTLNAFNETLRFLIDESQLVFKFLHERPRMWKPLIIAMISVLKTRMILAMHRALWERCCMTLLQSIEYWEREQVLFALKHGFVSAVVAIMIDDPVFEEYDLEHDNVLLCVFRAAIGHLQILDERRQVSQPSLYQQFLKMQTQIMRNQSALNGKKIATSYVSLRRNEEMYGRTGVYVKRKESCRWPLCNKDDSDNGFATKSICKGCRLA